MQDKVNSAIIIALDAILTTQVDIANGININLSPRSAKAIANASERLRQAIKEVMNQTYGPLEKSRQEPVVYDPQKWYRVIWIHPMDGEVPEAGILRGDQVEDVVSRKLTEGISMSTKYRVVEA